MQPAYAISEHPLELMEFCLKEMAAGHECVLVTVVATDGPSSRAPGTQMVVSARGVFAGYVSNGCVDADIARAALESIEDGMMRRLRYGAGSPFWDIVLPCGGALEVVLMPSPSRRVLEEMKIALGGRRPVSFFCDEEKECLSLGTSRRYTSFCHVPAPLVTLAGRGAETLAFMELSAAAGYDLTVLSPDAHILERAGALGVAATALQTSNCVPPIATDPFSAVLLLFHDHEWETPLLRAALEGEGYYIGAMGSHKTQALRLGALYQEGVSVAQAARIRGPVGLIPGARDAQTMAISALSEIISAYHAAKFTFLQGRND